MSKFKEKFKPFVWFNSGSFNVYQNKEIDKNSGECEKIADEHAIGFAEWLVIQYNQDTIYSEYIIKELLEIYKKNKYDESKDHF